MEFATAQAASLIQDGHKNISVMDLKGAYNNAKRDQLLTQCRLRLRTQISDTILNLVVDYQLIVKEQEDDQEGTLTMGVTHGDPVSRALFNLFMDSLLEKMGWLRDPRSIKNTGNKNLVIYRTRMVTARDAANI